MSDQESAKRIHRNDTQRLLRALEIFYVTGKPWSQHLANHQQQQGTKKFTNVLQLGLTCPREQLYNRINRRCDEMIKGGLEAEVRNLLAIGYDKNLKCFGAIGYRHMLNYINGDWSEEELLRLLARDTRRYAKRQYTWFSKIEDIQWMDIAEKDKILDTIDKWLNHSRKI